MNKHCEKIRRQVAGRSTYSNPFNSFISFYLNLKTAQNLQKHKKGKNLCYMIYKIKENLNKNLLPRSESVCEFLFPEFDNDNGILVLDVSPTPS